MSSPLPLWMMPFALALLAIALLFGRFSPAAAGVAAAATLAALVYSALGSRFRQGGGRPAANLLPLLPGHLLLLFGLGTLARPDALAFLWTVLPVGSVVYDWVGTRPAFAGRTSILTGLYAILWLVVFFLLERLIAEGKALSGHAEVVAAMVFGAAGVVFVVTGAARHRRATKE